MIHDSGHEWLHRPSFCCRLTCVRPSRRARAARCSSARRARASAAASRSSAGQLHLGSYPIVTSQHSSTTLYQFSYHLRYLFFYSDNRIHPELHLAQAPGLVGNRRSLGSGAGVVFPGRCIVRSGGEGPEAAAVLQSVLQSCCSQPVHLGRSARPTKYRPTGW
jgi:hypothetical protein